MLASGVEVCFKTGNTCISAALFQFVTLGVESAHNRHDQPAKNKTGHKYREAAIQVDKPTYSAMPDYCLVERRNFQFRQDTNCKIGIWIPSVFAQSAE